MATILDNFDRADSADLGANWDAGYTGFNSMQIASNRVRGGAADGVDAFESYNAVTPGNDQFAKVTLPTFPSTGTVNGSVAGVMVRGAAPSTVTFYYAFAESGSAGGTRIAKEVAGVFTSLTNESVITWANGDKIILTVRGSTLRCYRNGSQVLTSTDSAIASGRIGLAIKVENATSVANVEIDDLEAGDVPIAFVAAGTEGSAASGNIAPGLPAGIQANDVLIMAAHTSDQNAMSADAAWTEIIQGNGGGTTSRLAVWYHRYDGSTNPSTTITHSGGQSPIAGIAAFRGCKTSGSPVNVTGTLNTGTDLSIEHNSVTPTLDNCMLLMINGSADDNVRNIPAGFTAAFEDTNASVQGCFVTIAGTPDGSVALHWREVMAAATGSFSDDQENNDPWASVLIALEPASSGSALQQAVSDSLAFTESLIREARKVQAESVTLSEALAKRTQRLVSESLVLSEDHANQIQRALTESVTLTESVIANLVRTQAIGPETVALTESLSRRVIRAIPETVSFTEADSMRVGRTMAESVGLSEQQLKQIQRRLTETATLTESLRRTVQKAFAEGVTLTEADRVEVRRSMAEAVTLSEQLRRQVQRAQQETISFTENFTARIIRIQSIAESVGFAEQFRKTTQRTIPETVGLVEAATRQTAKRFIESAGLTENLGVAYGKLQDIAESVGLTESLRREVRRPVQEIVGLTEQAVKMLDRRIAESVGLTENVGRQVLKLVVLNEVLGMNESLDLVVGKRLTDTVALAEGLARLDRKTLSESLGLSEALTRSIIKLKDFSEGVSFAEELSKRTIRSIDETVGLSEDDRVLVTKAFLENVGLTEAAARRVLQDFEESPAFTEVLDVVKIAATTTYSRIRVSGQAVTAFRVTGQRGEVGRVKAIGFTSTRVVGKTPVE